MEIASGKNAEILHSIRSEYDILHASAPKPDEPPAGGSAPAPLRRLVEARGDRLTPQQRVLAQHVLSDHRGVAFSNVAELARAASVSEATVVRFANALGFRGYPALQREIRRIVRADLDGTDRFRLVEAGRQGGDGPVARIAAKEMENLEALRSAADPDALRRAAKALKGARRVLVAGARGAAPLAFHLWFALDKLGLDVTRSLSADSEATDRLGRMDRQDAVVVIGFPRYLRAQTALLDLAGRRGVPRIVVTDSPASALRGEIGLYAPAESTSFVAFHAAPLVLLNALIEEVAALDRDAALEALRRFEAVAAAGNYFDRPRRAGRVA